MVAEIPSLGGAVTVDSDGDFRQGEQLTIALRPEKIAISRQRPPNGNAFAGKYKPETTWNYELGLKSTFFDRLRFNAAVFYIDYRDRLFQTVAFQANQFVQLTENIGASRSYGGEFDVSARLTQDLYFTTSFGVTRASSASSSVAASAQRVCGLPRSCRLPPSAV